jgi:glutamate--cysteine ligase
LEPLEAIAQSGQTLAAQRLEAFHGRWRKSVEPAFEECAL